MNRKKGFPSGFSLIELLLGLSIFSVIVVCVYSTFWGGIMASRRSQKENAAYYQMRLAFDLISKELENMVPYDFSNSYPAQSPFEGQAGTITFLSASPQGLRFVRYYLASPDQARIHKVIVGQKYARNVSAVIRREEEAPVEFLMREEWGFADYLSAGGPANGTAEVIARDIPENGLTFSFGYLENEETSAYRWEGQWRHNYLPAAVRVGINFGGPAAEKNIFIPHGSWGKQESS